VADIVDQIVPIACLGIDHDAIAAIGEIKDEVDRTLAQIGCPEIRSAFAGIF